jgi:hypothetical protein
MWLVIQYSIWFRIEPYDHSLGTLTWKRFRLKFLHDINVEFTSQNIVVGRCVKPNICICEDGRIAPSCAEAGAEDQAQDCSGTDEDPRVADPHSFYPDPAF